MPSPRSLIASATAALAAVAIVLLAGSALAASHAGYISVTLTDQRADPSRVMRVGDRVTVKGIATGVAGRPFAVLQIRHGSGRWHRQARAAVGPRGAIRMIWHVRKRAAGVIQWRVIIKLNGRIVGGTSAEKLVIGSAFVPCMNGGAVIPSGEGLIVGGVYEIGGPYPGIDRCSAGKYNVQALDNQDDPVASANVAGGHGYRLAIKPGSYVLASGKCTGPRVKVTAGQIVHADVYCPVP